ncbi:MAG: GTP 3',8-cyclase MoaA [Vicinamibacteria bacterium]|nr:GTP 3',8-cyclase MoaA [Vicinamibacteria bacterium]
MSTRDRLARPLTSLRLSVTDRCNLRCHYCMPEAEYAWLPREDILDFEETTRLACVFASAGATRLRLTGGEPLLRRDLPVLVAQLAGAVRWDDLALTTNGILLAPVADALKTAGLRRITVSLDTLDPVRFKALTRFDELQRVREGLDHAARVFPGFKIDTVVMRGVNEDEIETLVGEAARLGAEIRFIEYMDVGGATRWTAGQVFSRAELLASLTRSFGVPEPLPGDRWAPAARFRLPHGQVVGVISSTTEPFCATCDRSRLTADGMWYRCLYATSGTDLRARLRDGATDDELLRLIAETWQARADQGAEDRLRLADRRAFVTVTSLKRDPHLEMHTRGG